MRQNETFLLKELEGSFYLLPYGQMIADHKPGVKINDTGVYLWNLLEQEISLYELLSRSAAHFEISEEDLSEYYKEITQFIMQLISYGMVIENVEPIPDASFDTKFLVIGKLGLKWIGPKELFSEELKDFAVPNLTKVHQTISVKVGMPTVRSTGLLLLQNKELMILEQTEQFVITFPQSAELLEMHLKKDGSSVTFYCLPPFTDTLKYDVFHALRLAYMYVAQKHGMVVIHSASVLYNGKALLFSGPSGMGKSTHTNLWKTHYNTPIINGDLNMLAVRDNQVLVYGLPWCGTSGQYSTQTYPLHSIILLNRGNKDFVEQLSPDRKQLLVLQRLISPSWTKDLFECNLSAIQSIVGNVNVLQLYCTKEKTAVDTIKEYIDTL